MKRTAKSSVQYIDIDEAYVGQRIDNFLIARFKTVPKTKIYRILRKGEVRVNKKRAAPSYRLQIEDKVRIPPLEIEREIKLTDPPKELVKLLDNTVLFEDKTLLIINKPAGIPVHGGSKMKWGVIEILKILYPQHPHLELAHRLDQDTSGCLILVKKRSILKEVHEILRSGQMLKEYWALTKGHWPESKTRVNVALRKNTLSSGERIVKVDPEGKESITIFEPIKKFTFGHLVKATLLTGRTHQIRVHAQFKGHPIAGDEKYGDKEFNKKMRELGLKRLFLHAHTIEFTLASINQTIRVTAPLDEELEKLLHLLR